MEEATYALTCWEGVQRGVAGGQRQSHGEGQQEAARVLALLDLTLHVSLVHASSNCILWPFQQRFEPDDLPPIETHHDTSLLVEFMEWLMRCA